MDFMDQPVGAGLQRADRVDCNLRVRLEFRGRQLSSDGGLVVMRELYEALGLSIGVNCSVCPPEVRKPSTGFMSCCDNRCSSGWLAMRVSTVPTVWLLIHSWVRLSSAVPSMRSQPRPLRFGGSKPRRLPLPRTALRWQT